jgi:hypothetical protein
MPAVVSSWEGAILHFPLVQEKRMMIRNTSFSTETQAKIRQLT